MIMMSIFSEKIPHVNNNKNLHLEKILGKENVLLIKLLVWWIFLKEYSPKSDAPESTVEVGGRALSTMEPHQLKKVIRSALLTLDDLIQFNLVGLTNKLLFNFVSQNNKL